MKTVKIYINIFLLSSFSFSYGQNSHFITSGTIEYEKSVNTYAFFKKSINKENESFYQPLYDEYIKSQPQFKKLKSTLNFSGDKTLFTPASDESPLTNFFANNPMINQNNTTFTDLNIGKVITQKVVYDDVFLLKDSVRKIKWKITDERREIAGFTCRRANAIILDSVYVVAFYTEQIIPSGGPESFNGLPGMILGVALPHENITWFATKVTESNLDNKALIAPKKGKPVNNMELKKILYEAVKNWGNEAQIALKAFSM